MSAHDRIIEKNGLKFIRINGGRLLTYWDCIAQARRARTALATGVSRSFKVATEEDDLERLECLLDDVDIYTAHVRKEIEKRRGVKTMRERINMLRNTTGRTPEEAEAFHRKADELELGLATAGAS